MKWPKISVITPSFNQGRFIEQTIKSVLDQGYPNLEFIIQDGGSSDNTLLILKKYRGKLIFENKKDKGQTDAINKGLKKSTGDILYYLNSDDILLPGALKLVAGYFQKYPQILWLSGQCLNIDKKGQPIRSLIKNYKDWWLKRYHYSTMLTLNYICQPATFWRRSAYLKIGPLDENLNYVMDYDYWLRLGKLAKPGVINKPLAAFRIHSSSKTVKNFSKQLQEQYATARRYTNNPLILALHLLHRMLVQIIYSIVQ